MKYHAHKYFSVQSSKYIVDVRYADSLLVHALTINRV